MGDVVLDAAKKQEIIGKAFEVLEAIGIVFDDEESRSVLSRHGVRIEGKRAFFDEAIIEEAIASLPRDEELEEGPRRAVAYTYFGNAPYILDDRTGSIRLCTIDDAIMLYKLNEQSPLTQSVNPGCADPSGNDAQDKFVAQVAMSLKYSDKPFDNALRATANTSNNGDVYGSARTSIQLVKEFYGVWDKPVMSQTLCPNPPLGYDAEALANMRAVIDEKQPITLCPCTLGFMTGPETIMGVAVHDLATMLAGVAYIQLACPGLPTYLVSCSTICDMRTMQPNYGCSETTLINAVLYETCSEMGLPFTIQGGYGDGARVDYQAGMEATFTAMLPFVLTDAREVMCTPGLMSSFACGSFHKAILDEEMIRNVNRALLGADTRIDPDLIELLQDGIDEGSFLTCCSMAAYRRDNYITEIFDKRAAAAASSEGVDYVRKRIDAVIAERLESYVPPERTRDQMELLNRYLPSQCAYAL